VHRKRSVLLVDTDSELRASLSNLLRAEDYRVFLATNGSSALRELDRQCYDALILDVLMPRLDGLGVLRALHARPQTERPRVIFVISVGIGLDRRLMGVNIHRIFVKPVDADELLGALEGALRPPKITLRSVARRD